MPAGPKLNLPVQLLGLDEKANPRTSVPGTITDGRNWTMDKDGRMRKRAGLSALSMLDESGSAVTGGRELATLGDELVLCTRDKVHSRDAISGAWIPRGRRALESARVIPACATNAVCNGMDSLLQADTATIGRYVLVVMSGGTTPANDSESGWMLVDGTSGSVLRAKEQLPTDYFGVTCSDTGETSARFIAFAIERGTTNLHIGEWDSDHRGVTWSALIDDIYETDDSNAYGLQPLGYQAAPYAVCRVAQNIWLVAYQQTAGGALVVRKVTRTAANTFTLSSATTIEATLPSYSIVPAISWSSGASDTATIAGFYHGTVYWGELTISTMATSATGNLEPAAWTSSGAAPYDKPSCRGATSAKPDSTAYFFFDVITYDDSDDPSRSVYLWAKGNEDAELLAKGAGLLSHAAEFSTAETGEVAVGIAHLSSWQPSAFIMRVWLSTGASLQWSAMSIGAHFCAGDYAGRGTSTQLPRLDSALALGILNEPISPGGPGTTLLKLAFIDYADTSTACSQPAEANGALLLPGTCLKSYDGQHVTEAAFPLGPETMTASESAIGRSYGLSADGVLVPYPDVVTSETESPVPASSAITLAFAPASTATIDVETAALDPYLTTWNAGTAYFDLWVRIVDPTPGETYELLRGASSESYILFTDGSVAWQNGNVAATEITSEWTRVTWSVSTKELVHAVTTRLKLRLSASSTLSEDTATFQIAIGGAMAPKFDFPLASIETGTRLYRACLAWTDSQGRTQRSQISPSVSHTNTGGLANLVTIPMVTVTERSPVTNLDNAIHPAVIEIYRTGAGGTTFYRVGTVANVPNAANASVYDGLGDVDLIANEKLYTTGGTVEHWPPIGCSLVASHQGRAFVASIDNTVLFTAFASSGEGLVFSSEFVADTGHIPGKLTALLSLDDKLAVCTDTAVAALAGIGPELTGTPVYDSPMVISTQFGPVSQRACARVPTGIGMITAHGVYMLDRGLGLQWTGAAVTDEVPGSSAWTAATYTPAGDQIRFSTSGLVIVHDLTLPGPPNRMGQWTKWSYPTNVWAWATAEGVLYQLQSNGNVYQADSGYTDYGTNYQEWVRFAVISPTGTAAWSRIWEAELTCDIAASCTLKVGFTNDDYGLSENANVLVAGVGGLKHAIARPKHGQCSRMTIWIGESAATSTAGITLDAVVLKAASKGGLGRLGNSNRATRST
jgi:hypothetical protein